MMESKRILNSIGRIDEKYIVEAETAVQCESGRVTIDRTVAKTETIRRGIPAKKEQGSSRKGWKIGYGWGALAAACVCVIALGVSALGGLGTGNLPYVGTESGENISPTGDSSESKDSFSPTDETPMIGITIPPVKVELPGKGMSADMLALVIYQGRCYVEYEWLYDMEGIVGEYVGTVKGTIDEWSSSDDYLELTGSVGGDIYTVKGMAPEFMLCQTSSDGNAHIFINNSGLKLETGADLFEDRLCLTGNYRSVEFETRESWYDSKDEVYELGSEHEAAVSRFIEAMDEAEFMWAKDIPLEEGQDNIYDDKEIYHLYFRMNSGMNVHLRLFEGGYVMFAGLRTACVQVDEDSFSGLINYLTSILQK